MRVPDGLKPKDLIGIPWLVALALQADGWWLRSDIIWSKPNPMPESVTDRPTKAHEYVFLMAKSDRYVFEQGEVREPFADERMGDPGLYSSKQNGAGDATLRNDGDRIGKGWTRGAELGGRNVRSVWQVATQPYSGAHFATMPPKLVETCIKAGSRPGDVVLDPFAGAGTTLMVARRLQRRAIGVELNPGYVEIASKRIDGDAPLFNREAV